MPLSDHVKRAFGIRGEDKKPDKEAPAATAPPEPFRATAAEAIDLLNDLLKKDPEAIRDLFAYRVRCNGELADHPTVQVRGSLHGDTVGVLGLINGMLGAYAAGPKKDYGPIYMQTDEDGRAVRFGYVQNVEDKLP